MMLVLYLALEFPDANPIHLYSQFWPYIAYNYFHNGEVAGGPVHAYL